MSSKRWRNAPEQGEGSSLITRRRLLTGLAASAIVVGFDPLRRTWVRAGELCDFDRAPPLDGVLVTDQAARDADATDQGNIVRVVPCAVLRPGSVEDIQRMIRYCRPRGIKVAPRGQGHTTFGQGLTPGLIVEMSWLNRIHAITPAGADVDAGVLWKNLVIEAFNGHGLRARGLTGYLALTVGGTLSVGGVSPNFTEGTQIEHVQALEVVTGEGYIQRCSPTQHPDLFEAVLGGLGQCGIITRAVIDMVPAQPMTRTWLIQYTDNATFFRDFRMLLDREEVDGVFNLWLPFGTSLVYSLNVIKYFHPDNPPDGAHLLRGLSPNAAVAVPRDESYLDNVLAVDTLIDAHKAMGWSRFVKPWFDVWLPDSTVEGYVGEVVASLTPMDWSPTGFILTFAQKRSALTRPFFRVPDSSGGKWVYLFDILNDSMREGDNPDFVKKMLARNRNLYEKAREAGGTRYPIGALEFAKADWITQYGESWTEFASRKQRYDPDNILTPGPGIF